MSFISLFITLLAIMNPIGNAAIFISLTQGVTRSELVGISIQTAVASFCVLVISAALGMPILNAIGVTMEAFKFGGGLILMRVGFSMFSGHHDKSNYNPEEHHDEIGNLAVSPLAIPLITGPGAMVTVIHAAHAMSPNMINVLLLLGVILLNAVIVGACLYATTIKRFSLVLRKKSIIGVVTRLCGLLIIAIASTMILGALKAYIGS